MAMETGGGDEQEEQRRCRAAGDDGYDGDDGTMESMESMESMETTGDGRRRQRRQTTRKQRRSGRVKMVGRIRCLLSVVVVRVVVLLFARAGAMERGASASGVRISNFKNENLSKNFLKFEYRRQLFGWGRCFELE